MANNMRFIWSFSTTCRKKLFLEKQIQFGTVNKKTENTVLKSFCFMPTHRMFLATAQIKINQLIPFSFFQSKYGFFSSSFVKTTL